MSLSDPSLIRQTSIHTLQERLNSFRTYHLFSKQSRPYVTLALNFASCPPVSNRPTANSLSPLKGLDVKMVVPSTGRSRLPGCALYFFFFMSLGSVTPFIPVIWRSKGLSGERVNPELQFFRVEHHRPLYNIRLCCRQDTSKSQGYSIATFLIPCLVPPNHAEVEVGLLGAVRPIALLLAGPVICALTGKYGVQQTVRAVLELRSFEDGSLTMKLDVAAPCATRKPVTSLEV